VGAVKGYARQVLTILTPCGLPSRAFGRVLGNLPLGARPEVPAAFSEGTRGFAGMAMALGVRLHMYPVAKLEGGPSS